MQENIKRALNESVLIRWSALLMISLTMFASYYFYDIFSAIKSTLQAEVGLSNADYGAWYGAYSLFNAFGMALIGGIILDKWGIRRTGIIFISFVFLGTFMTAYGASVTFSSGGPFYGSFSSKLFLGNLSPALKMMITGRALFGLGAETFYVVLNKIIAKWFKGHELALAFAVNVSFGRLGTAAVMILSPRIVASAPVWDMAGWLGAMLTLISVICFFAYIFFDVKFDRSVKEVSLESDDSVEFRLRHVLELFKNRSFIYITLLCVTFYSAVFPFLGYTPDFLMNKFGFSEKASGLVTTILPFGTIVFTPIFGWFCDKKGKSASVMILGSFILILVFLTFTFTTLMPYIPLFFLGVAFSLVPAAMWPAVARIVESHKLGSAYGIMFSVQNWGLMLFPWIIGLVLDATNKNRMEGEPLNYTYAVFLLSILGILGITFAILLKRDDKKVGYGIELPHQTS